jgi:ADP-ribosyl-[dinitrogen reductase] hydrolase
MARDEADTTAALCGQVAGVFYGEAGIPARSLERLWMVNEIRQLADALRTRQR